MQEETNTPKTRVIKSIPEDEFDINVEEPVSTEIKVEESSEERLYAFVEEQINLMSKYSDLGGTDNMPGFYELNGALMSFNQTQCSLIALEVMARNERDNAKEAFDDFLAERYLLARETLNLQDVAKGKWYSTKELEYYVRTNWHTEYKKLAKDFEIADSKLAVVRRLLDNLSDLKYNLSRICKNIETEMTNFHTLDISSGM